VTLPWAREYAFDEAYAKTRYDVAALTELAAAIESDTATREKYFNFTTSGSAKSTAEALPQWKGYWCGFTAMKAAPFTACYCGTPASPPADAAASRAAALWQPWTRAAARTPPAPAGETPALH
jgi:hypothetical protein